jgi:hypothetical protein
MRFQLPDGKVVGIDEAFVFDGTTYGAGWLRQMTSAQRTAFGATEVAGPEPFDERFYFGPGQPRALDQVKAVRRSELAAIRYAKETGGITVSGVAVATDYVSQAKINGALSLVAVQPATLIKWKTAAGFVTLDHAAVQAIALAVGQHVQACFAREAELADDIDACATVEDVIALDLGAEWPT